MSSIKCEAKIKVGTYAKSDEDVMEPCSGEMEEKGVLYEVKEGWKIVGKTINQCKSCKDIRIV